MNTGCFVHCVDRDSNKRGTGHDRKGKDRTGQDRIKQDRAG
jgi:hypothetical protein